MRDALPILDQLRYWTLYPEARAFIHNHLQKAAREGMTESQMGGIQALFAAGERLEKIRQFANARVQRFRDAGRPDQQDFWTAFLKNFDDFFKKAPKFFAGVPVSEYEARQLVLQAFVHHLIAENRYRKKVPLMKEEEERDNARKTL
jgi:hypothetical protein